MIFYKEILMELEKGEHSFERIFELTFRRDDEIFFEENNGYEIKTTTYGECKAEILRLAELLRNELKDEEHDSVIGLCLDNSPLFVEYFWALLLAGHRPLLLNTGAGSEMLCRIAENAGAGVVIGKKVVPKTRFIDAKQLASVSSGLISEADTHFSDEVLLTTSGVTGEPKLCIYDGEAISRQILNSGYVLKHNSDIKRYWRGNLRLLAFLPFYHVFGLVVNMLWFSIFHRVLVFLPDMQPETILSTCRLCRVTHIFGLPILWNAVADGMLNEAKKTGEYKKLMRGIEFSLKLQDIMPHLGLELSRVLMTKARDRVFGRGVRFCISGGGAIRRDTLRIINGIGYPLYVGYGMTELGITSVELRKRSSARLQNSVGKPFPSVEYRIEDGTLRVRGGSCCTAFMSGNKRIERNSTDWYDTNDSFTCDSSGNYFCFGRRDEMVNGENGELISPDEIENSFVLPYAKNVSALGLPGRNGDELVLVIEVEKGLMKHRLSELLKAADAINSTLPTTMRIRRFYVTDTPLPMALNAKVSRSAVERAIQSGDISIGVADMSIISERDKLFGDEMNDYTERIIKVYSELFDKDPSMITPDTHFLYDLSGDSLTYFALVEKVERACGSTLDTSGGRMPYTPREFAERIISGGER